MITGTIGIACEKNRDKTDGGVPASPGGSLSGRRTIDLKGSLAPLYGSLFAPDPVLVLPGYGWHKGTGENDWFIMPESSMIIPVLRRPKNPLTLLLEFENEDLLKQMQVFWDGQNLQDALKIIPLKVIRIMISTDQLTPGVHELNVFCSPGQSEEKNDATKLYLKEVQGMLDEQELKISMEDSEARWALVNFVKRGVLGIPQSREKQSGFLFKGPQEIQVRLSLRDAGELSVTPHNLSSETAEFFVYKNGETHRIRVAPYKTGPVEIPVAPGYSDLTFRVEGVSDGLFLWGAPYVQTAGPTDKTPIILLTLDTTRQDAIAPYSGNNGVTPALQAFADKATVFNRACTTAPWTLPSHASIFTGLYPSKHGAGVRGKTLEHSFTTLTELLRQSGYFTAGFSGGPMTASGRGIGQGFCLYRDRDDFETRADRMTEYAEAFLEAHHDKPFFLFMNYFDPHFPYDDPENSRPSKKEHDQAKNPDHVSEWEKGLRERDASILIALLNERGQVPENVHKMLKTAYQTEISFLDKHIGELFNTLKRLDLFEKSMIIIVSDHGEHLGERDLLLHGYRLDRELMVIPFIIKWPYQQKLQEINYHVTLTDLFPTILNAAGIRIPDQDGLLLESANDGALSERQGILLEEHGSHVVHYLLPGEMKIANDLYGIVFDDTWIVVWEGGRQCFQWQNSDWVEISCSEDMEVDIDFILQHFRIPHITKSPPQESMGPLEIMSAEEEEELRLLGYIQ